MVVLPYKDRLELFSRYLQQLVMESLGKAKDLKGGPVEQGLTVFGNKGSTDQHAFVQQLRDGRNDFFVTFIEVLRDRAGVSPVLKEGTAGDYLAGFLYGTRDALSDNDRLSITLTLQSITPRSVGALIALFERTVGLYAQLIQVNAYDQPGVEAGKKAAAAVLALQARVLAYLTEKMGHALTSAQIASGIGAHDEFELVFKICRHLAANPSDHGIERGEGPTPFEATFKKT